MSGNSKLQHVANVSLLPVITCPKGVPCALDCYDKKACRMYPTVRACRAANTELAKHPKKFFADVSEQLDKNPIKLFRLHVGGDMPSYAYLASFMAMARRHPDTIFLAFTKRYAWINAYLAHNTLPPNVTVILSAWPGYSMDNPHGLPVAWMRDERNPDERIPDNALECPGNCESCGMCWQLPRLGCDVVFDKH